MFKTIAEDKNQQDALGRLRGRRLTAAQRPRWVPELRKLYKSHPLSKSQTYNDHRTMRDAR